MNQMTIYNIVVIRMDQNIETMARMKKIKTLYQKFKMIMEELTLSHLLIYRKMLKEIREPK